MTEQDRLSYPQGGDREVANAYQEREARLASDAASILAGCAPGHDEQTAHAQGRPTVEAQMTTHGAPAPRVPDTDGRG
jgi:hypothetical protein